MVLPRITSRTPLTQQQSPSFSMPLPTLRKSKHRASFVAVLVLVVFSTYIFFVQRPALTLRTRTHAYGSSDPQLALSLENIRNAHQQHSHSRPPIKLSPAEELAAVSSFLASLPQNVIPNFIDPTEPIDPQLVVDFDTQSSRATEEVREMVDDVWTRNPVFLYCKLYSPISREIKTLLDAFHIAPLPTIIDVDVRDDAEVLKPLIERLTDSEDLPVLLIGGKPVGTIADIRALHKEGKLEEIIKQAGGVINGSRKRKHRRA